MSPDQYNKLEENIRKTGKYPSLIVLKQGNSYILLDGHNRAEILRELNYKEAWCEVWELDDKHAKLFLATVNRLRGTDDVQKRVKLVNELYAAFDKDRDALLELLPESEKSINALLRMAEKDYEDVEEQLEDERVVVESELAQVVDEDEAHRMAGVYRLEDEKIRLTFRFENPEEHERAVRYFGEQPDVRKLMALLDLTDGRNKKT